MQCTMRTGPHPPKHSVAAHSCTSRSSSSALKDLEDTAFGGKGLLLPPGSMQLYLNIEPTDSYSVLVREKEVGNTGMRCYASFAAMCS
jgi:hypothetical protein